MTETAPTTVKPHRGWLVFTLGVLGLGVCFLFGTFAWSVGNRHLAEMDDGDRDPAGRGMTAAGRILGMAGVLLTIAALLYLLAR